eukprot:Sro390_g132960.2  (483) ;mRNA; r:58774-60222
MAPIIVLQILRRQGSKLRASRILCYTSLLMVLMSIAASILFPPLQLPQVQSGGPYDVGAVSFFLPIQQEETDSCDMFNHTHVPVRLLYPTIRSNDSSDKTTPYLSPSLAMEFLQESMKAAAPPPLKPYDWLMHHWLLTELPIQKHAALVPQTTKFPLVVYSHGLMGNADIYSYQAMSLATQGMLVLMINHLDGSAPVAEHHDGSKITFDYDTLQLWKDGKKKEYTRERQRQTEWRARELVGATKTILTLNNNDDNNSIDQAALWRTDAPHSLIQSFEGRIDKDRIFFMGHSFGGATALTAAFRQPDLLERGGGVIAHEPAVDWVPDGPRRSLLPEDRLQGLAHNYTGGVAGWEFETTGGDDASLSLHSLNLLFLFSGQWRELNWGESHILEEMFAKGRLGTPDQGVVDFGVIDQANHNEFSDMCMITPLWLARGSGVTGARNPLETAHEIEKRTWKFISSVISSSPATATTTGTQTESAQES